MPLQPAATPSCSPSTSNPGSVSATSNNTTMNLGIVNIASTALRLNFGLIMNARNAQGSSGSGVDIPVSARRALPGAKSNRSVYARLTGFRRRDVKIATADLPWSKSTNNADAPTSCTFSRMENASARTKLEFLPRETGSVKSANCPNTGFPNSKSVYPAKTKAMMLLKSSTHRKKDVSATQQTPTVMRRDIVNLVHHLVIGMTNQKSAYVRLTTSGTYASKNVNVWHLTPSIS